MHIILLEAGSKTEIAFRIAGRIPPEPQLDTIDSLNLSISGGPEVKSDANRGVDSQTRLTELKKMSAKQLKSKSSSIGKHYGKYLCFVLLNLLIVFY